MESSKHRAEIVVYTYGVFDLCHRGHVELLRDAKKLGDKLIVGVFSDEVAESFKRRPVISLDDRMAVIKHLQFVDEVLVQEELEPDTILRTIRPHILAKGPGAGWGESEREIPGATMMQELGGAVVMLNYHDGISTSAIIEKIKNLP